MVQSSDQLTAMCKCLANRTIHIICWKNWCTRQTYEHVPQKSCTLCWAASILKKDMNSRAGSWWHNRDVWVEGYTNITNVTVQKACKSCAIRLYMHPEFSHHKNKSPLFMFFLKPVLRAVISQCKLFVVEWLPIASAMFWSGNITMVSIAMLTHTSHALFIAEAPHMACVVYLPMLS